MIGTLCVTGYGWCFPGANCETNIDDCFPNPCVNGDCIDLVGDYRCICGVPYTGKNCSVELNPCANNPCKNRASCVPDALYMDFTCYCPVGFTGRILRLQCVCVCFI